MIPPLSRYWPVPWYNTVTFSFKSPTLRVFTQFSIHSHKTICLLYHVRHQNKNLSSKQEYLKVSCNLILLKNLSVLLMKVILNRGPGFDPIVGSRAVPESH